MPALLELDGLVRTFGGLTATDQLSFRVEQGQSIGLIGPNGAGKTTVFSLIMGSLALDAGRILLAGRRIDTLPTHRRIRLGLARTWQIPRPFFGMDVLANIEVGLMEDSLWSLLTGARQPEEARAIARSVGLGEADFHRNPSQLAMGDLRKLELARARAMRPSLLLLDEVFAGLTAGEIERVSALLRELRQEGVTLLIVSHDLRSLEPLVDGAVAIHRGAKVAQGSYGEVLQHPAVRSAYLGTGEEA